ncbi:MAG: hypothetical protein U9N42_10325 [Campylobacterota bacterium]|nr:hypothetical protein [Campylobacterota bacterium]
MKTIKFIEDALMSVDDDVMELLSNMKLSQNEKDDLMLPLLHQKKVLTQTLSDLEYLKQNPPTPKSGCKAGSFRDEES